MAKVREKANLINLVLVEQTSNEHHANLSGKHENSRDKSIRHDGLNDASALLPACHPPEVGQTNKRKDSLAMQIEDGIFDAINALRYHSKKDLTRNLFQIMLQRNLMQTKEQFSRYFFHLVTQRECM